MGLFTSVCGEGASSATHSQAKCHSSVSSSRWGQYLPVTQVSEGWGGVRQDQTDLEWFVWIPIMRAYAPFGLLHVLLAQMVRRFWPQYLCTFYITFSLCITLALIGRVGTALCLAVPVLMFVVLLTRLKLLVWLAWCLILILFNTHFFTSQLVSVSLHFMPELVKKMSSWSLAGFVYFLSAFLQLKYVVLYGLPSVLARVEGYNPPRHPRCTLMTYRLSDVWRYFDHGLYRFMLKHIYIPWVGADNSLARQLQGTALVFTFVYVWHGVSAQIFWWAAINFLGVVVEKLADHIARLPQYRAWELRGAPVKGNKNVKGEKKKLPFTIGPSEKKEEVTSD
ncbi:Protein-cysteine N-palmitoyltransferase HHAT [Portunus trituberculatus]|uniref:Protein-cysteine N-palmitoyltransferase HHAT n=1 Tax=Portunus trituberculatus TaxID=210409 RepID=A0A5B7ELN0_PORTR|nr:Protein-cysteine N-palmitoyltransferase HHAT [Portunus trituberculatus]